MMKNYQAQNPNKKTCRRSTWRKKNQLSICGVAKAHKHLQKLQESNDGIQMPR